MSIKITECWTLRKPRGARSGPRMRGAAASASIGSTGFDYCSDVSGALGYAVLADHAPETLDRDDRQKLADRAVAAQEDSQKNLGEVREELALMRAQIGSLAKVLTEVD